MTVSHFLSGGTRKEIRGTLLWKKTVTFTEGEDEGVVNPDELVVGKKSGTGLRMSVIKFDLSDLLELQQDNVNIKFCLTGLLSHFQAIFLLVHNCLRFSFHFV